MGILISAISTIMGIYGVMTALISASLVLTVRKLAQPDGLMEIIEHGTTVLAEGRDYATLHHWARDHAFVPAMVLDFRADLSGKITVVGVWKSRKGQELFISYNAPKLKYVEFVTTFDRYSNLSTASTKYGVMVPTAPGSYVQAFDGRGLDELFQLHHQGLEHLRKVYQLSPINLAEPTDRLIADSLRHQMAYIQTLPLWQLRGAWWFWGRRNLLNNKTIAERYPRG